MFMLPCRYHGYFDPTSIENRIWGDGIWELVCVIPAVQGFCLVQCWKHVVSYHTQI
jgi:hypothetical protein